MYLILLPIVGLYSKTCLKQPLKDIHNKGRLDKWALDVGQSIAECSLGAFCNTFDLHLGIFCLEKTNNFMSFFLSGLLRQVLLYTIKFNEYPI